MSKQKLVTIFGGSGFVGRYVVNALAKQGFVIQVVTRDPEGATYLKTAGSLGQVILTKGDARNQDTITKACTNAAIVINLIGILYEKGSQNFKTMHIDTAANIARAAKKSGAERLIHISALGIDKAVDSRYAASKLQGEKEVLSAFPEATIIRPSIVFGPEDKFFNKFAKLAKLSPLLPLIGGGHTKFQPVYVQNVAEAIAKIAEDETTKGKIFAAGGPEIWTFKQILEFIINTIDTSCGFVPIPFTIASLMAVFLELLPEPILTRDQVSLLKYHNVIEENNRLPVLQDLAITPVDIKSIVPAYLSVYK